MFRNRLYYSLKPWLPGRLRMAMRRAYSRRVARSCRDEWPILESAGRKPEGWTGWPEGKQFAFVLTHDVESQAGLDNVRQLAELEMELGFRSSFNFIPEGGYQVSETLRDWLTANGFEVGVHDLHHDGRLYRSREAFQRHAKKINLYLKQWGAVGFRSGFMLHKLDWLHDLNIAYDASTFDTDPFEPQPDGVGTIFPFWVPAPNAKREAVSGKHQAQGAEWNLEPGTRNPEPPISSGAGYVELPYTLVQDSTLFLLLQEKTTDIWKRKLDWIVDEGGMALLNVHPDYVGFARGNGRFPAGLYAEFLQYVREHYSGGYWHAVPREVADFGQRHQLPKASGTPLRVAMVAHSFYEHDGRIIRYAESLADRGDQVEVLALQLEKKLAREESVRGVKLSRLHRRLSGERSGRLTQLLSVVLFTVSSGSVLAWRHLRRRYDLIHVHNIPDFLVFSAWFPRLLGAKVILDIHDLVPELYGNKFDGEGETSTVKWLRMVERVSCRHVDHVIISNDLWREVITRRSIAAERCSVFVNHVDTKLFSSRPRRRGDDKFILMFPGSLHWHQGLDIAVRAMSRLKDQIPRAELHIYGRGPARAELEELTRELRLSDRVLFFDNVPLRDIPQIMADADVGVVPKRADSFGDQAYSTKIMEFMSQGVPVVISRTRIDSFYFDEEQVKFFESNNDEALASRVLELASDPTSRARQAANGLDYVNRNSWERRRQVYYDLVDSLART